MTSKMMWRACPWLLAVLVLALLVSPAVAQDEEATDEGEEIEQVEMAQVADAATGETRFELMYTGEFIDQDSEPVTAVFPLEFKLYPSKTNKRTLWSESHFVSVVDGSYTLALGTQQPLPRQATEETVYLAVELGGKEVVRQPLRARLVRDEIRLAPMANSGTAEYAERAGDAETLGGMGPEAFARANQVTALERKVQTLESSGGAQEPKQDGGGGGGYLGGKNWQSQYAGGSGGIDFNLACPEGYVMTGIQGRSGAVLDAIRIVCQQLE